MTKLTKAIAEQSLQSHSWEPGPTQH